MLRTCSKFMPSACLAVAVVAASLAGGAATGARADEIHTLLCFGHSGFDARLHVNYVYGQIGGSPVDQLDAELEVNKSAGFKKGQKAEFVLSNQVSRTRPLVRDKNGDLDADLKLTRASKTPPTEWPKNLQRLRKGDPIVVKIGGETVLSCKLV